MGWASGDQSQRVTSCSVGLGVADVELGGVLLPEVREAGGESAARPADVAEAGGAPATARADPAVALLGALAQGEAVGGELGEGVVAPLRDVLQAGGDALVPGGGVGQLSPRELRRRTAAPGSRRRPVMPLTASRSRPVPSPPMRMWRS